MNFEKGKIENKDNSSWLFRNLKRTRILASAILVIILMIVFTADTVQQKRFAVFRSGYEHMENEQYKEVVDKFQQYLSVDSELYWILTEKVNSYNFLSKGLMEPCSIV